MRNGGQNINMNMMMSHHAAAHHSNESFVMATRNGSVDLQEMPRPPPANRRNIPASLSLFQHLQTKENPNWQRKPYSINSYLPSLTFHFPFIDTVEKPQKLEFFIFLLIWIIRVIVWLLFPGYVSFSHFSQKTISGQI